MTSLLKAHRKTVPGSGVASRYRALMLTHHSLEERLDEEMKRPLPDTAIIQRIKRRKLAIKDELASISRLLDAMRTTADELTASADPANQSGPAQSGPAQSVSARGRRAARRVPLVVVDRSCGASPAH